MRLIGFARQCLVLIVLLLLSSVMLIMGQNMVMSRFVQSEGGTLRPIDGLNPFQAIEHGLVIVFYALFPAIAFTVSFASSVLARRGPLLALLGLAPLWFAVVTGCRCGVMGVLLHLVGYALAAVAGSLLGVAVRRGLSRRPGRQ
jgi:hypothetical protein